MSQIILSSVTKQYEVRKRPLVALNNISFTVERATFLALSGPSGSGKSTILQIISGIEPPTTGQVVIDGVDIARLSSAQVSTFRRKNIGIIFQQFYLDPTLTLKQNIELPAMFFNIPTDLREQRTAELAASMGLSDHLDHLPSELSGGQIQRAAVARAIYNQPAILIADEPTSNLDQANLTAVIDLFRQMQQAYGTTIIIATHDPNIAQFATQTIKLDQGNIVQ